MEDLTIDNVGKKFNENFYRIWHYNNLWETDETFEGLLLNN